MNNDLYGMELELETDSACHLIAYDKTDYATLGITEFGHHGVCEFVTFMDLDKNEEMISYSIAPFMGNNDPLIRRSFPYLTRKDGVYVYYRIILPLEDPNGAFIAADKNGNYQVYYNNPDSGNLELIEDYQSLYENAHDFGQEIVIGEKLGFVTCKLKACLFKLQKESIDAIIKNGCDFTCKTGVDTYKRDFLLSAMLVLDYYVQTEEITKAQQLIKRLQACGGICADDTNYSDCGCGGK